MSQILVDSSVWVDFFNKRDRELGESLTKLIREKQVCTLPMIMAEVASGAQDEKEYLMIWFDMDLLPKVSEPEGIWEMITKTRFSLLRRGIKIGLVDLYIAAVAHLQQKLLFTRDKHFKYIAKVIPLEFLP